MRITFDVDTMTLGEVEEFEAISGLDITQMAGGQLPSKAIIAIVYLQQRRENPAYTLEDARKVRVSELEWGEPDPTPAAAS